MSDLDQAVQAEIDAYRPATVPPFDALAGRKRARDRRRLATGGAALSAVALSAAVLVPSLLGGGPDRLPALAAPSPGTGQESADTALSRAAVRPAPADGNYQEALATGVLRADPATGCLWLEAAGGKRTQLLLQGEQYSVDFGASPAAVLDGGTAVARVGDRIEAAGGLSDDEAGVAGCPVPPPVYIGRFERPSVLPEQENAGGTPVPPQDPAGAEICKDPTAPDAGVECYDVGPEQARRLAAALATARPLQPGEAECMALPVAVYRIIWLPTSGLADPVVWTVPSGLCLPMTVGATKYDLPDDAQADTARIWDTAGLVAVDETTTGRRSPTGPQD